MPPPHHLPLIYLLTFLLSLSSSLSPPTLALTNLTDAPSLLPTPNHNPNHNCIPRKWYQRSPPTFAACRGAILYLPGDAERGTFHNGRPLDRFWLPRVKTCLGCAVTVRVAGGDDDEWAAALTASWGLVRERALGLAEQCLQLPKAGTFVGGWTTLGEHDELHIILEKNVYDGGVDGDCGAGVVQGGTEQNVDGAVM